MRIQGTLLILLSLFFIILTITDANAQTTKWYKYEAGMEEAGSTGKPMLLEFYADWCSPCIAMEEGTYPDPRVISEMKDFIAIKVDTQVRIDIESKYHIGYYPTIVFLNAKGDEISRHVGYLSPEDMVTTIKESRGKLPKQAPGFEAINLLFFLFTTLMFFLQKKHKKTFI
jgi:thiol:disulfide interchange protein DsbD